MTTTQQAHPVCHIMVGPPGVGKSTLVAKNFQQCDILSTDNYLLEIAAENGITYNEAFKQHFGKAQARFDAAMADAIANNRNFVVDRTNMTVKTRKRTLSKLPKHYSAIAWTFNIPSVDELEKRVKERAAINTQDVPRFVIEDMLKRYEAPTVEEGFAYVAKYDPEFKPSTGLNVV